MHRLLRKKPNQTNNVSRLTIENDSIQSLVKSMKETKKDRHTVRVPSQGQ